MIQRGRVYAGINAWETRRADSDIECVLDTGHLSSEVSRAGVHAYIYKASVHIVITILCWNWEGRLSHFYFNGIGDFKRG